MKERSKPELGRQRATPEAAEDAAPDVRVRALRCPFCHEGCSVCKRTTWIELLPCGLVHPNVLRAGGLDPEEWGGFAFGLGLSRLVMLHHDIDDVRHLLANDLRFLEQF